MIRNQRNATQRNTMHGMSIEAFILFCFVSCSWEMMMMMMMTMTMKV
ncbi:hypothetical protein BofuT4_P035480.1 [Botrytis cinerea T4]|uniref:Uncharacterized protein n=1 Tax=Botryotinia fuckeliana (strain T4) TaxID=999810 RepID=G2Y4H8_BOTF4|nr:hypothetical protein BofuT4_P035480.1 [Botrytis cinerea T4]